MHLPRLLSSYLPRHNIICHQIYTVYTGLHIIHTQIYLHFYTYIQMHIHDYCSDVVVYYTPIHVTLYR